MAEATSARSHRAMEQSIRKEYDEELRWRDERLSAFARHGSQGSAWRAKEVAEEAEAEARAVQKEAEARAREAEAARDKVGARVAGLEERLRHSAEVRVEFAAKHKAVVEGARAAAVAMAEAQGAELDAATSRAKLRIDRLQAQVVKVPVQRTQEAWARLSAAALRKARYRERAYVSSLLEARAWDMGDWATVLDQTVDGEDVSLLDDLWETKEVQQRHSAEVRLIFKKLEREHWGERLGMHCRLELNMTYAAMLQLGQAASKVYSAELDFYAPKVLATNPFDARDKLIVPRILPPRSRVEPDARTLGRVRGAGTGMEPSLGHDRCGSL